MFVSSLIAELENIFKCTNVKLSIWSLFYQTLGYFQTLTTEKRHEKF